MWKNLAKPILVLAPMADVTDAAFRKIIAKYGKPDVMWTEFVSADGLFMGGRDALMIDLKYLEQERPIVAQFFTARPENMEKAGKLAVELGFDGFDINMGCPDRSIEKQGAGAAHIKDPDHAVEIIEAAKRGTEGKIPVSVKTRIGYNKNEIETWVPKILSAKPEVLTLHARTRKEMSKVPARWEHVAQAVAIRDERNSETLIFGNGDVTSIKEAEEKVKEAGCDGAMIGRGIFGNPWFFNREVNKEELDTKEILEVMLEHTKAFEELFIDPSTKLGASKNFYIMKKHYKAYVNGFDGAKELRIKLMETDSFEEVERITQEFINSL